MPDVEIGSVPFREAIDHFRAKLNIPSRSWDEMRGQVNAKGFTVAGGTKADLLRDIRTEIEGALREGTTITDFRKGFDQSVQKHGWTYRGKRGWRTRVIYDTNLRTARMAGRWQQIQRVKERRPYLEYQTVGDRRVRPQHAAWDSIVLPVDDPWWSTHYPPNGWGCRCTVRSLSRHDLTRYGLEVSPPPEVRTTERVNTETGEVYGEVPVGIDVGWDYNVGKAWLGPDIALGEKVLSLPPGMRRRALQDAQELVPRIAEGYRPWAQQALARGRSIGEIRTVGYLTADVVNELIRRGHTPTTAVITVSDREIMHMIRDAKANQQIPRDVLRRLPTSLQEASAILWDTEDPALVYVLDVSGDARKGKLVVRVNFAAKGRAANNQRHSIETNMVRTGGMVGRNNLQETRYMILSGRL